MNRSYFSRLVIGFIQVKFGRRLFMCQKHSTCRLCQVRLQFMHPYAIRIHIFPEHLFVLSINLLVSSKVLLLYTYQNTPLPYTHPPPLIFFNRSISPQGWGGIKEMCVIHLIYIFWPCKGFCQNPLQRVFSFFPSWGKCCIFALKCCCPKSVCGEENVNSF